MNPELDKEIDSLLRRDARLAATGYTRARVARAVPASTHLDADELGAFAEGALPNAARTAAASHLADCDECRGLVVRLSASADRVGERPAAALPASPAVPWWKSLLGSLVAPSVLRYATPVLVLGLVGIVSFIALRSRDGNVPQTLYTPSSGEDRQVASAPRPDANMDADRLTPSTTPEQRRAEDGKSPAVTTTAAPVGEAAASASHSEKKEGTADVALAGTASDAAAKGAGPGLVALDGEKDKSPAVTSAPAAAPPAAKSAPESTEQPKSVREETSKQKAAEPEEEYAVNERNRQAEQNRAMNQTQMRKQEMPDDSARSENRANVSNRGGGAVNQTPSRAPRAAMKRGRSDDALRDGADEDAGATERRVAGHRFRRQNGAWVDVNYRSSMSMMGVRRGSDQYRALVADMSELGRIADQLSGEVIVVVKGKAYRFR